MYKKGFSFICCLALVLALAACGSNGGSGGDQTAASGEDNSSVENAAAVGMDSCVNCHAAQTEKWLDGYHGNLEGKYHASATVEDAIGFPDYDYFSDETCATCHDQLGDGANLVTDYTGNIERPVVGCESCHGGGQLHYGTGPIPYAKPDAARCGQCHDGSFPHAGEGSYHPESEDIYEKVIASKHFSGGGASYIIKEDGTASAKCSKCHTDEGAKQFKHINGGYVELGDAFEGKDAIASATPIQCSTCHDAHKPLELLFDETLDVDGVTVLASAEYNTCTSCHQDNDGYHGENSSRGMKSYRVIYDTHFDDDTTAELEGYNIDPTSDRACRQCHDVHAADTTLMNEWSRSGHGGRILAVKEAAEEAGSAVDTLTAGAGEDDAAAFMHYDWKTRGSCQKCHTSTGFKNFTDDMVNYDYNNNDFSKLSGLQNEVLSCDTCHTNNAGHVRNPGVVASAKGVDFPDVDASNTCLPCHSGRSTDADVKAVTDFTNARFVNSHYLPAAQTLWNDGGYEYDVDGDPATDDYTDKSYFKHATIGTVDAEGAEVWAGTGTAGPCVACHMDESTHTFSAVATDEAGAPALPNMCSSCHNTTDPEGSHYFDIDIMMHEQHGYHEALDVLAAALSDAGHPYLGSYPYFSQGDWTNGGAYNGEMLLGAAYNYGLLHHEPGAYAHNRYYAKRLIFDSIDYADNGVLDGTVAIDEVAYPDAAAWLGWDGETAGFTASRP